MGMSQLHRSPRHDTNITPNRAARSAAGRSRAAGQQIRARPRLRRSRRCSASPRRTSASRWRASRVNKGVVSGGGKTVTYGQLIGDKLFNVKIADRTTHRTPGVGRRRSRQPVQARRDAASRGSTSRRRSTGTYTYVHNIRVPGMLHGRVVRPRGPGRLRRRHAPKSSRSTRARSSTSRASRSFAAEQLPRRRRAEGVRRDPGGRAAQGEVGDPPALPGSRQPLEADAGPGRAGKAPARIAARAPGNFDAGVRVGGEQGRRDLQVPVQRPRADRPVVRGRRRDPERGARDHEHAGRLRGRAATLAAQMLEPAAEPIRVQYSRARARSATRRARTTAATRPRSCRSSSASRCGCQFMRWDEHGWDNYGPAEFAGHPGGVDANGNIVAYSTSRSSAVRRTPDGDNRPQQHVGPADRPARPRRRSTRRTRGAVQHRRTGG